jgi:hypothetical protein
MERLRRLRDATSRGFVDSSLQHPSAPLSFLRETQAAAAVLKDSGRDL